MFHAVSKLALRGGASVTLAGTGWKACATKPCVLESCAAYPVFWGWQTFQGQVFAVIYRSTVWSATVMR